MSTARTNPGGPGSSRGRGLDALFEDTGGSAGTTPDIEADLAALLDNEVLAAETGRTPDLVGKPAGGLTRPAETIDVPPAAAEARPAEPASGRTESSQPKSKPSVSDAGRVAEPERRLPTTKRFGAIIMDTGSEPLPSTAVTRPADVVPFPIVTEKGKESPPPGPGAEVEPAQPPAAILRTDEQKTIVISRLDSVLEGGWQKALHKQIDDLYKQVATEFSSPPQAAERMLTLLREARELMIDSPDEYVNAEYRMVQVRTMLDRIKESREQSRKYGPRILAYEAGWLLALVLLMIFGTPLTRLITTVGGVEGPSLLNVYPIFSTMLWGGIGGVVGALYHLWWHISEKQDFDRHYGTWYFVQPLMGLVLGGIVFLLMAGGLLVLQVDLTASNASTATRLVPYLVAVLAGFRQNFVYEQFDRLVSVFAPAPRGGGES